MHCLLSGYAILATVLAGLLIVAIISTIVIYLLRQHVKNSYSQLRTEEDKTEKDQDVLQKSHISRFKEKNVSDTVHEVNFVKEGYAESCNSDFETASTDLGPSNWRFSSISSNILDGLSPVKLQLSLIINSEKNYLAGKITRIEGMPLPEDGGPNQVKIHIVLLPVKKYILKTKYHSISGSVKMDEYFKMKFKTLPNIELSSIRYRLYCRRARYGMSGREKCLGELFVQLADVAKTRGGVTLLKEIIPRGIGGPP